jgi:hypothetical protein
MKRAWIFFHTYTMAGCVVDEHLGDVDTETSAASEDATSTAGGTDGDDGGASMSASSSTPGTAGSSDDAATTIGTATTIGEDTSDGTGDPTGEPIESCFDWAAPPEICDAPGDATARVTGDSLPPLDDEPCTVVSVESVAANADAVTLDCGELYELEILSDAPHLDLPLSGGLDVRVTATESLEFFIDETVPSFVIRAQSGEILVAWVNALGHDVDIGVDLDPVVVNVTGSGCGTFFWNELCDSDEGAIALQRSILEFGNGESPILLFDGNQAIVPADAEDLSVIAESVERIVCWDDVCGGDDSGPFDRITFLGVSLPGA